MYAGGYYNILIFRVHRVTVQAGLDSDLDRDPYPIYINSNLLIIHLVPNMDSEKTVRKRN
jgi:hypothetical protein